MNTHFSDMARQAFSFLERAGFSLTRGGLAQLRYETAQTFVMIGWDARSGELNVFVGLQPRKGEARNAFSLTDLLAMEEVDVPERRMPFQVAEESRLRPYLDKLAKDAHDHAQPALAGDRMFFRRLEAFRKAQAHTYMRNMELNRIRLEAEMAWQRQELDRLITLYTSIEDELTVSERSKLVYAKQHRVTPKGEGTPDLG